MLVRMSATPRVMTVKRGIGSGGLLLISFLLVIAKSEATKQSILVTKVDCFASLAMTITTKILLEQTQLLPAAFRLHEMIRRQFRTALVQPELLAGDLEAAADHPGHRSCALHPRTPLRVVVATAAHVADQRADVAIAVRII